jgi:hypothetical protein
MVKGTALQVRYLQCQRRFKTDTVFVVPAI